jgi:penicillin amidase
LSGIPTDGGFGVVDASAHGARAASVDAFMFGSGPSNRLVVELRRGKVRAESVWPGGVSAVPGEWDYLNLLPLWLTNDTVPLPFGENEVRRAAASTERFVP